MPEIHIHERSGFCTGVYKAIRIAEKYLEEHDKLAALGELIHNPEESERLYQKGLRVIGEEDLSRLQDQTILIRSHGVRPRIYELARENRLHLLDATCVIVKSLQEKIRKTSRKAASEDRQIVIFGKKEHPEVIGLAGNSMIPATVVYRESDLDQIDPGRGVYLFAQTTMDGESYRLMGEKIKQMLHAGVAFRKFDSLCGQCVRRAEDIGEFAARMDVVVFVSGRTSSNGRMLYQRCHARNPKTHWIAHKEELNEDWFRDKEDIGVCGSASTPMWYLEEVEKAIEKIIKI